MSVLKINKLGPIDKCELDINDYMIFMGPQASGKSTIAKSIFFFKNLKNILLTQIKRQNLLNDYAMDLSLKNRWIRAIRSNFLQIFGSTWCMDSAMYMEYLYDENIWIKISLKDDPSKPNYIWIDFSETLINYLNDLEKKYSQNLLITNFQEFSEDIKGQIDAIFLDELDVVYIPAGRSMITLLSSQLNYIYSSMDDSQKGNLDYCTQHYLERILQMKSSFTVGPEQMFYNMQSTTDVKLNKELLYLAIHLMKDILQGEYRNVNGEERLQVTKERYVKINFASSGQQEVVWILNVLFYYLLNNKKAYFIIEEPESHLFPNAQKMIVEFISLMRYSGNKILLTTHSPYILGSVNNLLYAYKISKKVSFESLKRIIHPFQWIRFEELSAFFIERGCLSSCEDSEFQAIENGVIDGASEDINQTYEDMVNLQYKSN